MNQKLGGEMAMTRKIETITINTEKNRFKPALTNLQGRNSKNELLHFSNHFMMIDGKPTFGICGEFHFSRYDCSKWKDELLKMKMGGITIVPTYVIWNHHEEVKGEFDWEGSKNLNLFVSLCQELGLQCILRIGPFAHGEVRNGGFPDWLYGEPCRVRSNDPTYLHYVERLYGEIGHQVKGLMYRDDGPVIGIQLENEFYHAGAPWEHTTGTSNEWVPGGEDGEAHIVRLKEIANEAGLVTPFYTATGWGGAVAPTSEVLPLWGGYAFWPWVFYDPNVTEHPITPEYIYRNYNQPTYNFDPAYNPEEIPFACCEMGGGMTVFYKYRFKLPYQSVEAMANIKVAGGCNFVGYYVFHGSSNPKGKLTPYLNEHATPKISYDYQAPIGEFGQVRDSYKRLKRQHYFYKDFEDLFCETTTYLPTNTDHMRPDDVDSLRYALRVNEGRGFIFMNNYQDHLQSPAKHNLQLQLQLDKQSISIPYEGGFSLEEDISCILPFNQDLSGLELLYATAQLLKKHVKSETHHQYFFFYPFGMKPSYQLNKIQIADITCSMGDIHEDDNSWIIYPSETNLSKVSIQTKDGMIVDLFTMTDEQSLDFWSFEWKGTQHALLTEATVLVEADRIRFESDSETLKISVIDEMGTPELTDYLTEYSKEELLTEYTWAKERVQITPIIDQVDERRMKISLPQMDYAHVKEWLLRISYEGDIGYAYISNELVHDQFHNGDVWEIGLSHLLEKLVNDSLYLMISPIKEGREVKSDSPMAARSEVALKEIAAIHSVDIKPVYEFEVNDKKGRAIS